MLVGFATFSEVMSTIGRVLLAFVILMIMVLRLLQNGRQSIVKNITLVRMEKLIQERKKLEVISMDSLIVVIY